MKYFFIGERELLLGFSLVGVKGVVAVTREEALEAFNYATGKSNALSGLPAAEQRPRVLIITEEISMLLEEEIFEWQKKGEYPLLVEVPGLRGRLEGKKSLTAAIREAIGIHV